MSEQVTPAELDAMCAWLSEWARVHLMGGTK
jgi:hypothetical protein